MGLLLALGINGYASDTFIDNQNGYAGAAQTTVPIQSIDREEPLSLTYWKKGLPQGSPTGRPAITPPLTVGNVNGYLTNNPLNMMDVIAANEVVTSVQFLTMGELKKILNNNPFWDNWLANEPAVYVTYSGQFTFSDMDGIEHVYPYAYRVFHGLSGNELNTGAGPGNN